MTGVQLPFRAGSELFKALTLVSVSDQAMGKSTRKVGQIIDATEKQWQLENEQTLLKKVAKASRPCVYTGLLMPRK